MPTNPSGLQYEDTVAGTGAEAVAGRRVQVHYTGWLHDPSAATSDPACSGPVGEGAKRPT